MTEDDLATGLRHGRARHGQDGAGELNYSSDIDLIVLFDETRYGDEAYPEARAQFIRATRRMAATLSDNTAEGYVFRTDLRLRPDPSVTPVCLSMEAAERYYESLGRTWERAAYIKARPCAGDIAAGDRFLTHLTPFVWRKHLDYAAIEEAHDMRLRIREHKGLHGDALEGRDLKLAPGGIREIEFFTQTRQLIAGGRDPSLRVRGTVEGLLRLSQKGWVPDEDAATFIADYRAHREVEHRLQMIADQQTHDLPTTPAGFARLAAFMDRDTAELRADLSERIARVSALAEGFFAPGKARPEPTLSPAAAEIVARWPSYPALRSDRAMRIFSASARNCSAGSPNSTARGGAGASRRLPRGASRGRAALLALRGQPPAHRPLLDIASTAPALASLSVAQLAGLRRGHRRRLLQPWPGPRCARSRSRPSFRPSTITNAGSTRRGAGRRNGTSASASTISRADRRGGRRRTNTPISPARSCARSGRWCLRSSRAGTAGSRTWRRRSGDGLARGRAADRDLGPRPHRDLRPSRRRDVRRSPPAASRAYYARLTQALVTALTAPMAEGRLYEADMRLRPSGRQGPVATSITSFETYQREEAWTWEHLALTRARLVTGRGRAGAARRVLPLRSAGRAARQGEDPRRYRRHARTAGRGEAGAGRARGQARAGPATGSGALRAGGSASVRRSGSRNVRRSFGRGRRRWGCPTATSRRFSTPTG
jgi:[glutamine synthetase] adenylyltransferase / [glutamine synthetase]-adenylyl-L-tyrosine phosphorylase